MAIDASKYLINYTQMAKEGKLDADILKMFNDSGAWKK